MALWDTPFLFANEKEADAVLDGQLAEAARQAAGEGGRRPGGTGKTASRNPHNNKRLGQQPGRPGRHQAAGDAEQRLPRNLQDAGCQRDSAVFSELFTALETQAVDGQENPFNTILTSKFYEVQKYLTVIQSRYSPWVMLASKKWWTG